MSGLYDNPVSNTIKPYPYAVYNGGNGLGFVALKTRNLGLRQGNFSLFPMDFSIYSLA